jgi:hypothetical protein
MPDTDPNQVRLTGENSFIRLFDQEGGPQLSRVSHWRILYSPAGGGHALFIESDVTDGAVQVYSDNPAMTRWLQGEIESLLYPPFAGETLPIAEAIFSRTGDSATSWTEIVEAPGTRIALTWSDFAEPFMLTLAPNSMPNRPHGVYSCFIPARNARISVNDRIAAGRALPQKRGDRDGSSACLALSETWVRP